MRTHGAVLFVALVASSALCDLSLAQNAVQRRANQAGQAALHEIDFKNSLFILSKKWFQLSGDAGSGIYRSYAALVNEGGRFVDFPNIFILSCRDRKLPLLTLHFPDSYRFAGFTPSTWIPKSEMYVRTNKGKFSAELNKNEFHIDLESDDISYLRDIWNGEFVEAKIGPSLEEIRLVFGNNEIDNQHRKILASLPTKKIEGEYPVGIVLTGCLATGMESATGKYWIIWGAVRCNDCDGLQVQVQPLLTLRSAAGQNIFSIGKLVRRREWISKGACLEMVVQLNFSASKSAILIL